MARSKWISFGAQQQLERAAKAAAAPATVPLPSSADAKKFGLENFGNTCYANSVLQALYFCTPFRDLLLQDFDSPSPQTTSPIPPSTPSKPSTPIVPVRRKPERRPSTLGYPNEPSSATPAVVLHPIPTSPPTLFSALQSLFLNISSNPGDKGTVAPRAFIDKLKELNDIFRSTMHQDAHEFLNYLLNQIVEEIEEDKKRAQSGNNGEDLSNSVATLGSKSPPTVITAASSNSGTHPQDATLVHKLFEGVLTSETRCLTCETVSSRDESFLDLSLDIEQNSSVTACLRQFSASEMLCQRNKFFCDSCCDLQEAEKRMKIKKLPNVLALHLKRFKYQEDLGKHIKLAYRVAFPFELRLFNTVDDMDDADRLYNLFAIVVHIGNGPHHGHYISIIKTVGTWLVFDDDNVYPIPEGDIPKYFGDSNSGSAYVLYYQAVDIDAASLGLRISEPHLPADGLANPLSSIPPFPFIQDHHTPILPPGLGAANVLDTNPETNNLLSSPATQSPQILPVSDRLPLAPLSPVTIPTQTAGQSPQSVSAGLTPITPTTFGTKMLNTLRRPPSMTNTKIPLTNHNHMQSTANGNDARKLATEKSPRTSASVPSFIASIDSSAKEVVPPLPPLPAAHSPALVPLAPIPQVYEPEKEEKGGIFAGGWFRKRKSIRVSEKLRLDSSPTAESQNSPARQEDSGLSHMHWFGRSSHSTSHGSVQAPLQPLRRATENGFADAGLHPDASKVSSAGKAERNGYDESFSQGSISSSPASASLLNLQTLATDSLARPASSGSTSTGPHLEAPPARKSSLIPSTERARTSFERKSQDFKALPSSSIIPSNPLPVSSGHGQTGSTYAPLPPPKSPARPRTHRANVSNGNIFSEPDSSFAGPAPSMEADGTPASSPSPALSYVPPVSRSAPPPASLASAIGANNSTGSTNSASSNLKRAGRKLSITAPMLGFGKRDKDKEKEREKERERMFRQ